MTFINNRSDRSRSQFKVTEQDFSCDQTYEDAVRQIKTRPRLLAQPKSMRPIIDATQREQRHELA